jgi:hypothetical protein
MSAVTNGSAWYPCQLTILCWPKAPWVIRVVNSVQVTVFFGSDITTQWSWVLAIAIDFKASHKSLSLTGRQTGS